MMIFLLLLLLLPVLLFVTTGLVMMFIGNVHHVVPELVPALGLEDTFLLMLPVYALGILGGIFSSSK